MTSAEKRGALPRFTAALARYKYALLVGAMGIALLLWPEASDAVSAAGGEGSRSDGGQADALRETEAAMEDILGKIQGVGRVDVMLTLQSGGQLILAEDSALRYSGSTQSPDDYDRSSQTVTVSGGSGQDVVVTQELYPQYRGALVVCEGGGSDGVRLQVAQAVSALTGLGTDRVAVVPWRSDGNGGAEDAG